MSRESRNLIAITTSLLAVGIVLLFSASAVYAGMSSRISDPFHFVRRQFLWIVFGGAAMIVAARIPTDFWKRHAWAIAGATLLLLALVFVPRIGTDHNTGARRWMNAGPWAFQPSELAKISLSIFLAAWISKDPDRIRRFFGGFLPAMAVIGTAVALVMLEPDLGSGILLLSVLSLVLFIAGARPHFFAPFIGVGGLGVALLLMKRPYMMERVRTWLDPWADLTGSGHQIRQSLIALGSGGLHGSGIGRGMQKLLYLPEGHTDFILANLGEELGFLGVAGILLLFVALGCTGWQIMRKTKNPFAFHLSLALTLFLILQAAINVAVVSAAVPTKGIPLPLMSYGGSSVMFTLAAIGILIRISNDTAVCRRPLVGNS